MSLPTPPPAAPPPPPPNNRTGSDNRPGTSTERPPTAPLSDPSGRPGTDPSAGQNAQGGANGSSAGGTQGEPSTVHNSSKALDLDAILDAALPKPPNGKSHEGLDPKKVLDALPDEAKKLVANLRDDYRRKTTSLSEQRRNLETRQGAWLAEQESALREKMNVPDDIDIFDPAGMQRFIEAKVAQAMLAAQEPIRKANAAESRKQELATFRQEHPDLDQYRDRIVSLVAKGMKPEDAYWRAKGEAADGIVAAKQREIDEAKKAKNAQNAAGVRSTGLGSAVQPGSIQAGGPKTAMEAYKAVMARRNGG